MRIFVALACLAVAVAFTAQALVSFGGPSSQAPELPASAPPVAVTVPARTDAAVQRPVPSSSAEHPAGRRLVPHPRRRASEPTTSGGRLAITGISGADLGTRSEFERAFRGRVRSLASREGLGMGLHIDSAAVIGNRALVRCTAAVTRPGGQLVASLRTSAEVTADDTSAGELRNDAARACGEALAEDAVRYTRAR